MSGSTKLWVLSGFLVILGAISFLVESVLRIPETHLWLYSGPLGGLILIFGIAIALVAFDPALLEKIPGLKPQPPAVPPSINQMPPPGAKQ